MALKNILPQFKLVSAANIASTQVSNPVFVSYMNLVNIQANLTGTPTGAVNIQSSADYNLPANNPGNWTTFSTQAAVGAAIVLNFNLTQLSFAWIRVQYVPTSGAGAMDVYITGKGF